MCNSVFNFEHDGVNAPINQGKYKYRKYYNAKQKKRK